MFLVKPLVQPSFRTCQEGGLQTGKASPEFPGQASVRWGRPRPHLEEKLLDVIHNEDMHDSNLSPMFF